MEAPMDPIILPENHSFDSESEFFNQKTSPSLEDLDKKIPQKILESTLFKSKNETTSITETPQNPSLESQTNFKKLKTSDKIMSSPRNLFHKTHGTLEIENKKTANRNFLLKRTYTINSNDNSSVRKYKSEDNKTSEQKPPFIRKRSSSSVTKQELLENTLKPTKLASSLERDQDLKGYSEIKKKKRDRKI